MPTVDARTHIDEANRRFVDAFNGGDVAGAAQGVYTKNARILPPGAAMVEGRDAITAFWGQAVQQLGVRSVTLATVDLQMLGDGAVEIGRATLTLQDGTVVPAKYVVVWKQEDGRWRWDIDIWNMNA